MGGTDPLRAEFERLRHQQAERQRIADEVKVLERDYPDYTFRMIDGHDGKVGIEAVRPGSEEGLRAVIKPSAEEIREALDDAALEEP